jgi:hypothetical protein
LSKQLATRNTVDGRLRPSQSSHHLQIWDLCPSSFEPLRAESHRDDLAFRAVASTLWSRATAFWRGTEADGPKTGAVGGVGNGGGASGAAAMKLARQPMLSMRSQVARVEQVRPARPPPYSIL